MHFSKISDLPGTQFKVHNEFLLLFFPKRPLDEGFQKNLAACEHHEEIGRNFGAQILETDDLKERKEKEGIVVYLKMPWLKFAP